jgi:rare lipoprotein A
MLLSMVLAWSTTRHIYQLPSPFSVSPWQCLVFSHLLPTKFVPEGTHLNTSRLGILVAVVLLAFSAQAHSRGFAWFFSHAKRPENCPGQSVVASYYASGRRTASGQAFDSAGHTAAHRTLPFGSQVTVTNPETKRSITVTINDRGPFTPGVTLDLSRGAAHAIGMNRTQWVCMD